MSEEPEDPLGIGRALRRRSKELRAQLSADSDQATAEELFEDGRLEAPDPPVPTHVPDWL